MKILTSAAWLLVLLLGSCLGLHAETLVLSSGRTIDGTIIRTNGGDLMLLTDYGIFNFGSDNIKEIKGAQAETTAMQVTARVPDFKTIVLALSREKWGADLSQIPATVIEKGMFRNVPYVSFRCSDDYEVNIYGDLKSPAAIEAGVYRKLLDNESAKVNCINFINSILGETADKDVLQRLSHEKDIKVRNDISFEITPPTDEDAYQGWWISVFSEKRLNESRATEKELKEISVTEGANGAKSGNGPEWSAEQMKLARPSKSETISFNSPSGEAVTDAEVVRVVDNAYLIWRRGASGGMVRLADLPQELRTKFGYDAAKAAGRYAVEEQRKAQFAQERTAAAPTTTAQFEQTPSIGESYSGQGTAQNGSYYGQLNSSGRPKTVYVQGYTRRDGTYVRSHYRSRPRR